MIDYKALAGESIATLVAYKPGKPIDELKREYGLDRVIKLASNENPWGPSPMCAEVIKASLPDMSRYPFGDAYNLRMKLSSQLNVAPDNICFGSGSNEIIELLLRTFVHDGEVMSVAPSFSVYGIIAQAMGSRCEWVPCGGDFRPDFDRMLKSISPKTRMIFVANPNNPTGVYINETDLRRFIERVPEDIIIAMDEAYIEFADAADIPDTTHWYKEYPNIVVLRTFSKAYGLAGLRIGYAIADKMCIDMLERVRQPFNTNMLAQAAAVAALDDKKWLRSVIEGNISNRDKLYAEFDALGLPYIPTQANFILVKVGNGEKVFNDMLKKGVIVRFMGAALKEYIRVSIGTEEECDYFITAFKEVLSATNSYAK